MVSRSTNLSPLVYPGLATATIPEIVFDPVASVSVSALLRIIRRNLWWIALVTVVVIAGAGVVLHLVPSRFQAEAVLQISKQLPPIPSDQPTLQESNVDDLAVNSEIEAVLSVPVVNDVINQLQLDRDPEFNPILAATMPPDLWPPLATVWEFTRDLQARIRSYISPQPKSSSDIEHRLVEQEVRHAVTVYVKGRSRIIVVRVVSKDSEKAAAIANAIASSFLQNRLNTKLAYSRQITDWLNGRLAELRSNVNQSEQDVQRLRTGLGEYAGLTTSLLSEQLSQLNHQLIDAQAEQSIAQAKFEQIQRLGQSNEAIGAADSVLGSPLIRSLREQRTQLVTQRSEEMSRLGPRNPDVISVNAQVAQVDREIAAEISRISGNAADQLKVLNSRVAALAQAKHDLEKRIDVQNVGLVDVQQVQRDAETDRKTYEAFAIYHDKMAGLNAIGQPEAELLSQATSPISPIYPRKLLTLTTAALSALFLSTIFALLRESLDQRFRSAQDVSATLGLPTLALVPRLSGRLRPETYVSQAPRSSIAEAIRYLYAELDLGRSAETPLKVLISSSLQGEGKTTTSTMLAREAATNGRKTLLINLDIRHAATPDASRIDAKGQLQTLPRIEQLFEPSFNIEAGTGLTRLSFRTALQEPFKLLYTQQFWRKLSEITSTYELVVIDSPPILSVPDAKIIAAFADKTVFLIKWGSTKRHTASEGLRHFRTIDAEICGVALTQVDPKKYAQYEDDYVRGYLRSRSTYYTPS
jgi:succinoglycan biosynthesis transport protein ExoP